MSGRTALAIDLAVTTGWAFAGRSGQLRSGSHRLVPGAVGRDQESAYSALFDWLNDLITAFGPTDLVWEAAIMMQGRSADTQELLFGLANTAGLVGYRRRLRLMKVNVQTVRAAVIGDARCGKPGVMAWCAAQGLDVADDNAADALAVHRFWSDEMARRARAVA